MNGLLPGIACRAVAGFALFLLATACSSTDGEPAPRPLPPVSPTGTTPAPSSGAPGRALLVGVGEFMSRKVKPLKGPVNDVPMMHALLRDRFGFEPAKMTTLLNEEATREAVIDALDAHIAALDEDEPFVFYLSGHGSQSPDRGDDEEDGLDETFLMYDSRTASGWDLSDDDLKYSLAKLRQTQAVVILDTCHSGSGTRGVLVQRAIEVEAADDPDRVARITREGPNEGGRGRIEPEAIEANHILLTAAAANQVAVETKIDGAHHGVFTAALVRALSSGDPKRPLFDFVHGDLQREVTKLRDALNIKGLANPQLEAPSETWELPLFQLQREQARVAWSAVTPDDAGRARLTDGARAGAHVGSVWGVYPADELDFAPAAALARGRCVALDGSDALLEFADGAPDLAGGARAVLVAAAPAGPIGLQLAGDGVRAALADGLQRALGGAGALTSDLEPGGWRVTAAANGFDVVLADESRWASLDAGTAVDDLVALTKHCAVVESFQSLEHASSALDLKLMLAESLDPPGQLSRGARIAAEAGFPRYSIPAPDDRASLENRVLLDVRVERPCLLTLVFVDDKGHPFVFFPNGSQAPDFLPDGRLTRGWVRIPDGLEATRARFELTISPPAGIQAIAAIVVDDAATAKDVRARLAAHGESPDGLIAELARLREDLLSGPLAHVDWDAATVTYVIDEE